jgi:hypothetical protein
MVMLGVFGVVLPIRQIAYTNPAFLLGYRGVVAPITVFGYMLTDTGHDGLFNLRTEPIQKECYLQPLFVTVLGLIVKWCFF